MGYQATLQINEEITFLYLGAEMGLTHSELTNFNIIPFVALILATPINFHKMKKALIYGLPIIILFHIINLVAHFPYYYQGNTIAGIIISFSSVTRMIIPFFLWFALTYESVFTTFRKKQKKYKCPICGEEKTGIIDHINKSHRKLTKKQEKKLDQFYKENQISNTSEYEHKKSDSIYTSIIKKLRKKE